MTKAQKSLFKELKKDKHREAFVKMLIAQQTSMGRYNHWSAQYLRKCLKKKVKPFVDLHKSA